MKDKIMVGKISVFTKPTMTAERTEDNAAFMITSEGTVFIYPHWSKAPDGNNHINIRLEKAYVYSQPHYVSYQVHSLPECATFISHS